MQKRRMTVGMGLMLGLCMGLPRVWAADEAIAEASTLSFSEADRSQLLQSIEATRQSDPELATEMEQQLRLLESGELSHQDLALDARPAGELAVGAVPGLAELPGGLAGATPLPMPVVDIGGDRLSPPGGGQSGGEHLPPEARRELEELFQQGTGDPSSPKDRELREKANEILEKYGVEAHEFEGHHEGGQPGEGPGVPERAWEQMAPEAREQLERLYGGREAEASGHETFGREVEGGGIELDGRASERMNDTPTREHETSSREFEAPTREYEAPSHEYEAPTHEYEAPAREYEAPTHEYEAPSHEVEGSGMDSTPEHAYEGPGPSSPDAQPPQP